MKHLILTGACYVDTILSVPFFPGEDDKLRATSVQVRRGGNCPNSIEVLQQLLGSQGDSNVSTYLIACLPARDAPATAMIAGSFGSSSSGTASPNLDLCIYRPGYTAPASSYILRSGATGSRTIVNHSDLPEMTADEFREVADRFFNAQSHSDGTAHSWWHFEGRIPETTLACIKHLAAKRNSPQNGITISVEVEKPGRDGLRELAALSDVVFYSKTWAEGQGYSSAEACLRGESASLPQASLLLCTWGAQGASALAPKSGSGVISCPATSVPTASVVDAVGAGDTFVAGILYKLTSRRQVDGIDDNAVREALTFAVDLATRKIQMDGFQGLA